MTPKILAVQIIAVSDVDMIAVTHERGQLTVELANPHGKMSDELFAHADVELKKALAHLLSTNAHKSDGQIDATRRHLLTASIMSAAAFYDLAHLRAKLKPIKLLKP